MSQLYNSPSQSPASLAPHPGERLASSKTDSIPSIDRQDLDQAEDLEHKDLFAPRKDPEHNNLAVPRKCLEQRQTSQELRVALLPVALANKISTTPVSSQSRSSRSR
ncbi:hypothetical protein PGT21_028257 [Puccinia graminis f. sp. tritici]|uniref:Uncharacterized protein n=1 Tax=Puccinia graminis f. sp. tritici TaxID=56615 RepID=A0A5B0PJ82_PUCGR|nr:hypothetical protein PGT21_028257 [Puccinia graminis f. sp. tritici]